MNKATFDPEKLRLIVAVAETASLSKVALRERLSQPYLSKVIGMVEAACGGRIFLRTGRGMKLTEFGEAVLPRFRGWLSEGLAMAEDIRGLSGTVTGLVRLATLPSLGSLVMGALFLRLRKTHPGIRVRFMEAYVEQVRDWLDNGQADLGVTLRYDGDPQKGAHPLMEFDMYLCAAMSDRVTRSPNVPFASLDGLPLVVHSTPGLLHRRLERLFGERSMTLNVLVEANSLGIQRDIAAAGGGYALLSHNAIAQDLHSGRLQASRIVDPPLTQYLDLEFSRNGPVTRPMQEVARMLRDIVREAAEKGMLRRHP